MSRQWVQRNIQQLARLQWRSVVLTGIAIPVVAAASWVLLRLALVGLAHWSAPWEATQLEAQGAWMVPLLSTALTWAGAARVARRAGLLPLQHGLAVGVVAAATCLLLWVVYHGAPGVWAILIPVLLIGAGRQGGAAAQATLADQAAQYAASSAIAQAQSPAAVAAAIGTHLAHPAGHTVALWQVLAWTDDGVPSDLMLLTAWPEHADGAWRPGRQLQLSDPAVLARLRHDRAPVITSAALPAEARGAWDVLGIKVAQLIPLLGADGRCTALLMVRAPSSRGLTGGGAGRYVAVGAQTELVLERFRLLEQGRQLGMLAERQRLAREFHDSIKQQVFAAGMQIGAARELLRRDLDTRCRALGASRRLGAAGAGRAGSSHPCLASAAP